MIAINDGGPAFPVPMFTRQSDGQPMSAGDFFEGGNGLSLRDWFAGMALSTMREPEYISFDKIAEFAYKTADAMIAARERKEVK